jgi:tetratricopeptide (TPR) repeat protein
MKRVRRLPELTTKGKIGIILLVVIIVGTALTFIITSAISGQLAGFGDEQIDFAKETATDREQKAMTTSAAAIENGEDKKADTIYQRALSAETDSTKKVELAINQSKLLNLGGKYDQAVDVAKKAETYSDDKYLISDWLGRLYALGKDYDNAATYYAKAESLVGSKTNTGGYTKQYYEDKIAKMKDLSKKE